MARKKIPSLRRHKASGQGVVTLGGKDHYCGKWPANSKSPPPEVEGEYRRIIGEWLSAGFPALGPRPAVQSSPVESQTKPVPFHTVEELLAAFLDHAKTHYVGADGKKTSQFDIYKMIMSTVRRLYGETLAVDFGPLALKAVRQDFIRQGMSRGTVNAFTSKARSIFRWAAANELIPGSVVHSLECVTGLQPGRSDARETLPIFVPSETIIDAVILAMPEPLRQLATVLNRSGARTGEVRVMRPMDIDRTTEIWAFKPKTHKGAWRGKPRTIFLGAACQAALSPLLEGLEPTDYVFSPKRSEAARLKANAARRKTPRWPSHMLRNAMKKKRKPKRRPGETFSTCAIGHVMRRAAMRAYPGLMKTPGHFGFLVPNVFAKLVAPSP